MTSQQPKKRKTGNQPQRRRRRKGANDIDMNSIVLGEDFGDCDIDFAEDLLAPSSATGDDASGNLIAMKDLDLAALAAAHGGRFLVASTREEENAEERRRLKELNYLTFLECRILPTLFRQQQQPCS